MMRNIWRRALLSAVTLVVAISPVCAAALSLDGTAVSVSLQETGYPDAVDSVLVGPGAEILGNTPADPIGSILFQDEYVDLSGQQIVYRIQGGGGAYAGSAPGCSSGCSLWGATPDDAGLLFSDLNFGTPGSFLAGVSLSLSNVFDVQVSNVTSSSFLLTFGSAGILNSPTNLGTITMNLDVQVAAVPLPASLPLLLSAFLGLGLSFRRRACNDANF